jgi:hypothetical protein
MKGACRTDDACANNDNVVWFTQKRSPCLWRNEQYQIVALTVFAAVFWSSSWPKAARTRKRAAAGSKPRYDVVIVFYLDLVR